MANGVVIPNLNKVTESITFNSNGKYIFDGHVTVLTAKPKSGNLAIVIGSNGLNTVFTLYNVEGTGWLRSGAQTIDVEYVTF